MNLRHINIPISGNGCWSDTCGNQRTGPEPEERRNLREALQSAGSGKEFYYYKNLLHQLDFLWYNSN